MPARGFAADHNRRRVDAEMLTIRPHPANHRLHILDLGGPGRLVHHAVFPGDTDVAAFGHPYAVALPEGGAVGGLPPAARQEEQALYRARGVCRTKNIDA
jgi:hypothetical protein